MLVVDEATSRCRRYAMYGGDRPTENLVEYGFRLPAAKDNRPVTFAEFEQLQGVDLRERHAADYGRLKAKA